jgi:hypothetical protein
MFAGSTTRLVKTVDNEVVIERSGAVTKIVFDEVPTSFCGDLCEAVCEKSGEPIFTMMTNLGMLRAQEIRPDAYVLTDEFGINERSILEVMRVQNNYYLIKINSGYVYLRDENGRVYRVDELGDTELVANPRGLYFTRPGGNGHTWFDIVVANAYNLMDKGRVAGNRIKLYGDNIILDIECWGIGNGWHYQPLGGSDGEYVSNISNDTIKFERIEKVGSVFGDSVSVDDMDDDYEVEENAEDNVYTNILGDQEDSDDDIDYDFDTGSGNGRDEEDEDY